MSSNGENRDKRLDNLKPWQPGQSGNPAGKKPGTVSLKRILQEVITESIPSGDMSYAEALVRKTMTDAFKGDKKARELVWNYIDGKPIQSVDLSGYIGETPIVDDLPKPDAPL